MCSCPPTTALPTARPAAVRLLPACPERVFDGVLSGPYHPPLVLSHRRLLPRSRVQPALDRGWRRTGIVAPTTERSNGRRTRMAENAAAPGRGSGMTQDIAEQRE